LFQHQSGGYHEVMNAPPKPQFTTGCKARPKATFRLGASLKRLVRVGVGLAFAASLFGLPAWFLTRFDPLGKAAKAFAQHQYHSALAAGQNHLKWFPNDRRAALMVARCLMRLGRAPEAEAYYQKAAPLDLADAQVRAFNLVNLHEPKQAASAYEELLSRWPDDVLALKRLAAVRMAMKQWRDVVKIANRLMANSDEEVAGQTMAAIAHHELKHYDQAITSALRVLELDHELKRMPLPRTLFWNNLALDLIAVGRTDDARRYLNGALAQSPDAGLMELVGLTYSQQGALDEAERCWRQAESWDPDNADVCLDLGRLAVNHQRWTEAVGFLKRAADRSTEAVEPMYNLSQAYRMLGNLVEAERYRRLADERRRARPETPQGTGADADLESAGNVRGAGARELSP
jgi:tetratricopeptide (TPR) repeat protein